MVTENVRRAPDCTLVEKLKHPRSHDGPLEIEIYLSCAGSTICIIRFGLYVTGYPQVGGHGIHIAHMLWGGLLMFLAQLSTFCFLGLRTKRFAAIVGGIGFGLFIDELGKFITTDNDYFFAPTPAIIYSFFTLTMLMQSTLSDFFTPQNLRVEENFANSFEMLLSMSFEIAKSTRKQRDDILQNISQAYENDTYFDPVEEHGPQYNWEMWYINIRNHMRSILTKMARFKPMVFGAFCFMLVQTMLQIQTTLKMFTTANIDNSYAFPAHSFLAHSTNLTISQALLVVSIVLSMTLTIIGCVQAVIHQRRKKLGFASSIPRFCAKATLLRLVYTDAILLYYSQYWATIDIFVSGINFIVFTQLYRDIEERNLSDIRSYELANTHDEENDPQPCLVGHIEVPGGALNLME